jgi:hypothetical protein
MARSMAVSHYKFYMAHDLKARKKLQWYGILGVSPHFVQLLHWPAVLTTKSAVIFMVYRSCKFTDMNTDSEHK